MRKLPITHNPGREVRRKRSAQGESTLKVCTSVEGPKLPPTSNRLLAVLPREDYLKLAPYLESVALPHGQVLSDRGQTLTHVFFPTSGIVSVLAEVMQEISSEIAIVGNEGMISVSVLLEGPAAKGPLRRSVVQVAGHAYRLRTDILLAEFERGGKLQQRLLRYTQALITQVAQIAACNGRHELEAQLCRWILLRIDRLATSKLLVTHHEIAELLGVRREGVTSAAGRLQDAGLIRYVRGRLTILDRAGLAARGCECADVIDKEYARLIGA